MRVCHLLSQFALVSSMAPPWARPIGVADTRDRIDSSKLRETAREMLDHGYDSYMAYAFPRDELQPISKTGVDSLDELGDAVRAEKCVAGRSSTLASSQQPTIVLRCREAARPAKHNQETVPLPRVVDTTADAAGVQVATKNTTYKGGRHATLPECMLLARLM